MKYVIERRVSRLAVCYNLFCRRFNGDAGIVVISGSGSGSAVVRACAAAEGRSTPLTRRRLPGTAAAPARRTSMDARGSV